MTDRQTHGQMEGQQVCKRIVEIGTGTEREGKREIFYKQNECCVATDGRANK